MKDLEAIVSRLVVSDTDYDKYIGKPCWCSKEADIKREIDVFLEAQTYIVVAIQKNYKGQLAFRVKNLSWTVPHPVNYLDSIEMVDGIPLDKQFGSVKGFDEVYFIEGGKP